MVSSSIFQNVLIFLLFFCISAQISSATSSDIIVLNETNWKQLLKGHWMVEFYAPWCPACKALQPVWDEFAKWSKDLDLWVAQIDVTTSPGLSGRFLVTALPTIFHVLNGEFRQYKGGRDRDSFFSFIEDKKYEELEAHPKWQHPTSYAMEVVSLFFKASHFLRDTHQKLHEEFGIPVVGSYLFFALITIVIGAFLGLILVCFIDRAFPNRPRKLQEPTQIEKEYETDDILDENDFTGSESQADTPTETEEEEKEQDEEEDQEESSQNEGQTSGDNQSEEETTVKKRKPRKAD